MAMASLWSTTSVTTTTTAAAVVIAVVFLSPLLSTALIVGPSETRWHHNHYCDDSRPFLSSQVVLWSSKTRHVSVETLTWEDRYRQLKTLYEQNGSVRAEVLRSSNGQTGNRRCRQEAFPGLSLWVLEQRRQYEKWKGGHDNSLMDQDKVTKLESLGFEWSPMMAMWKERQGELQDYYDIHGHILVSPSQNKSLSNFLNHQRAQYKIYQANPAESTLTTETIAMLDGFGMEWDAASAQWAIMFASLCEFANENGHCHVLDQKTPLAEWAIVQRVLQAEGSLDSEREEKLLSVGFPFETEEERKERFEQRDFEERLQRLIAYRERFGDCFVPTSFTEDRELAHFVADQRRQYRRILSAKRNGKSKEKERKTQDDKTTTTKTKRRSKSSSLSSIPLTPARIVALESIGFAWSVPRKRHKPRKLDIVGWNEMFAQLCAFREKHGHCCVRYNSQDEYQKLGSWVRTQRNQYRLFRQKKSRRLSNKQVQLLDSIGFIWNQHDSAWERRFRELTEYRERTGGFWFEDVTLVDVNGDADTKDAAVQYKQLWRWMSNQRVRYHRLCAGKDSPMTRERVEKLNSIGFPWQAEKRPKREKDSTSTLTNLPRIETRGRKHNGGRWMQRVEELRKYKEQYGDCNVPIAYPDNPGLATWVKNQRTEYRKWTKGQKTSMTEERFQKLQDIGFQWQLRKPRTASSP